MANTYQLQKWKRVANLCWPCQETPFSFQKNWNNFLSKNLDNTLFYNFTFIKYSVYFSWRCVKSCQRKNISHLKKVKLQFNQWIYRMQEITFKHCLISQNASFNNNMTKLKLKVCEVNQGKNYKSLLVL